MKEIAIVQFRLTNPIDLFLVELLPDALMKFLKGFKIMSKGLLHDDAAESLILVLHT